MLHDLRSFAFALTGDDRSPPRGLPPEAPLAMPPQVLERRAGARRGWLRFLGLRAA
jgi:hypothetical protein